ncbi:uncharacterized protein HHUB_4123 (plasmid) [Halobacterium hubeiense]|uniref:Uncharacterized protein n=1 Tax=Halobacterium hubeiense TaxID=1407499 RepID=A0A0U5H762_9EURY|nr:hypothetical protein [Halobacterium hubeiense]CQH63571.1 uncharacterized protein HHUB_4123 [Halobacterium hubeiense]
MGSHGQAFERSGAVKEFVDDEGRHYYIVQFGDESGRILQKQQSDEDNSVAEYVPRDESAMESMRMIAASSDFEVREDRNTQQNLQNLLDGGW